MDHNKKTVVLILGMHRSGTSAVTGVLNQFGASVPLAEDTVISADNPKGHWEHRGVNNINDQILRHFRQTWTTFLPLELNQTPPHLIQKLDAMLVKVISEAEAPLLVLKDPRFCVLLPLWLESLDRLDVEVKVIFCVRHPDAVVKSLLRRNQLCYERGLLLWLYYNFEAIRVAGLMRSHRLIYPDWLDEPEELYMRTGENLGISWPRKWSECSSAVLDFIDPSLAHKRNVEERGDPLFEHCLSLYQLIRESSEKWPDDILRARNESLKLQTAPWMNICAKVVLNERELWRRKINDMYYLINRNI